jgi:RNA polymerase sigma-70 factor (ECF subfamily)
VFSRRAASDAGLLAAAGRDPAAFGEFYDRYERGVVGYFMRRTRDPELASDLTAEVFAAALAAAESYEELGKTAAPWLFTIANNILVSSIRKGRVEEAARRQVGMLDAVELRESSLERVEQSVAGDVWVSDLLSRLPEDQRAAVRARVLEDRSYEEIASRLETSSLVIRKRVSRGLARLRQEVEEHP